MLCRHTTHHTHRVIFGSWYKNNFLLALMLAKMCGLGCGDIPVWSSEENLSYSSPGTILFDRVFTVAWRLGWLVGQPQIICSCPGSTVTTEITTPHLAYSHGFWGPSTGLHAYKALREPSFRLNRSIWRAFAVQTHVFTHRLSAKVCAGNSRWSWLRCDSDLVHVGFSQCQCHCFCSSNYTYQTWAVTMACLMMVGIRNFATIHMESRGRVAKCF